MIIQTAPPGARRFAMTMDEHTELAGCFARAFGNEQFEPAAPRELMFYVVDHHDKGWTDLDAAPGTDCRTGLPYNLIDTPLDDIARTSAASADFNERHHAFCGLLSSMHSWGLYNGRYGLSDQVLIDAIAPRDRPLIQRMLDAELIRQLRLKVRLADDPATAHWVEERRLFQNYKQLQFFDTLALYFNRTHEADRGEALFSHVPLDAHREATITLRPAGNWRYALSPYPFTHNPVEFQYWGRYIEPTRHAEERWDALFAATPRQRQAITLQGG